jgi:hypothetical protein
MMNNLLAHEINAMLQPYREYFEIKEDGTSQTKLSNTGRVGFFNERVFGVDPNSSRLADLGFTELKTFTTDMSKGRIHFSDLCVGQMTRSEYAGVASGDITCLQDLQIYKKMVDITIIAFEKKYVNRVPHYRCVDWKRLNLNDIKLSFLRQLEQDFAHCAAAIKFYTYDELSQAGASRIPTEFLKLSTKGDRDYTYPIWTLSSRWVNFMFNHSEQLTR